MGSLRFEAIDDSLLRARGGGVFLGALRRGGGDLAGGLRLAGELHLVGGRERSALSRLSRSAGLRRAMMRDAIGDGGDEDDLPQARGRK